MSGQLFEKLVCGCGALKAMETVARLEVWLRQALEDSYIGRMCERCWCDTSAVEAAFVLLVFVDSGTQISDEILQTL